jgi:hypothetical protein
MIKRSFQSLGTVVMRNLIMSMPRQGANHMARKLNFILYDEDTHSFYFQRIRPPTLKK